MKVQLMLTCLCDAYFGEVGIAAVRVLRAAGCQVSFPEKQTCCGQPPFNSGDWKAARDIAHHCLQTFEPDIPIVTPSGSCAAMMREGYLMLNPGQPHPDCYEVGEFLVKRLSVPGFNLEGSATKRRIAFHRACHGRSLGLSNEQERLVLSLPGIELVEFGQPEQCCGFGGAFSVTHGKISSEIGLEKLKHILDSGAETLISGDMGCLMHLRGLIARHQLPIKTQHYLELIAEALPK